MYTMVRKFLAQALVVLGMAFLVVAVAACSQPAFAADGLPEGTTTATQSTPATSETTSDATLQPAFMSNSQIPADAKDVPLPDHAKRLGAAYVVADNGKRAVVRKYTVDATTTDTLLSFYKSNMPSHGWTYADESRTGRYGGQVLKYTQGDRTCYVEVAASRALPGNGTLYITVTN